MFAETKGKSKTKWKARVQRRMKSITRRKKKDEKNRKELEAR